MDGELDRFRGLRDRDYAREGLFVCEGRLVIEKALDAGLTPEAVLCVYADRESWQARSAGRFPVTALGRSAMEELVGFAFHRGSLALVRRPEPVDPEEAPAGHALVPWNVTDPDNLGALVRTAAAMGAARVVLGPGCADPYSRKALRASMGCILSMPLCLVGTGHEPVARAVGRACGRAGGIRCVSAAAALVPGALDPRDVRFDRPVALLLGNEGWGLPTDVAAACDVRVAVPMAAGVDSLNVGAAGAVLMWELFGRRL